VDEQQALSKMISPGMRRPNKRCGGVMQIHITRACNLTCFNCTQGSNLRGPYSFMTPENFELSCKSLLNPDYFGTIGVFGGNPAIHPQFDKICGIMRHYFSQKQCGLWCNNLMGKGGAARKTFNPAVSNLNVHLDHEAFAEFKRDWPESLPFGLIDDSRHSPVFVSMQDVIRNKGKRWELIANCDINKHWSAMICEFRGELRGYFCEIAGAQAMLHQTEPNYPDLGVAVEPRWWQKSMKDFKEQVRHHCHQCGVPLRGYGTLAQAGEEGVEYVSITHNNIYSTKKKGRKVQLITTPEQLESRNLVFIDYLGGAKR